MSRARSRGGGSVTVSQRTQIQPQSPVTEDGVKCDGHQRRCKQFVAGPTSKNPGRAFYTCPLARDDPQRCKFFKWADEITGTDGQPLASASRAANLTTKINQGQTLGTNPSSRYTTQPTTPKRAVPPTPQTSSRVEATSDDEIDWEQVDTEGLEKDAIASTPGSQRTDTQSAPSTQERGSFRDRLREAVEDGLGKRKREDEEQTTPRRINTEDNPFNIASPPHPALTPSISNFEQLSAHLHRQDRLIRAGEVSKEGFRRTIMAQQLRIKELEERLKTYEK